MTKKDPTNRQREILDTIMKFIDSRGYPPTVREIGAACGLKSPRSVSLHLSALEKAGYIKREKDKSRAIEIVEGGVRGYYKAAGSTAREVPLIGRVHAGSPQLAVEDYEISYLVDRDLFGCGELFLLRAKGESMLGAHIMDGDMLVVENRPQAKNGDIIIAIIDDEATVKRYSKKGRRVCLVPENDAMEPIELSQKGADNRILGKVVGIIRRID